MARRLVYPIVALSGLALGAGLIWQYYVRGKEKVQESQLAARRIPETFPPTRTESAPDVRLPAGVHVQFIDVTAKSGVHFQHFDGRSERDYIMETMGSGLGWLDYDQDGLMDLFLVQGSTFVSPPKSSELSKSSEVLPT